MRIPPPIMLIPDIGKVPPPSFLLSSFPLLSFLCSSPPSLPSLPSSLPLLTLASSSQRRIQGH
jgi:hypothetical protein